MSFMKTGNVQTYYEVWGKGFPFLLLAGKGADTSSWQHQIEDFSREYRVIAFDRRGTGKTGKSDKPPGEWTAEMFADDAVNLLQGLGVERAHVLGTSLGGCVAQQLALRYPDKVAKLILCGTFSEVSPYGKLFLEVNRLIAEKAGREVARKHMLLHLLSPRAINTRPDLIEERMRLQPENPRPLEDSIELSRVEEYHNTTEELHKIKAPTLVLVGAQDVFATVPASKIIADRIPGARLKVISGGHALSSENPQEYNRVVLDFLAGKEV